jgi:hypothetical protein
VKLKGLQIAEIQESVTDQLKKGQKRNFRQLFINCMTPQNPVYMLVELILNLKKGMCLRFKKNHS